MRRIGRSSRRSLTVLCWHNVESTPAFPTPAGAGARGFEQQLRHLSRVANVVPLVESLDKLRRGETIPPRAVALTFDDGYQDNLDIAVPLLERFGMPATFFLVTSFLDGRRSGWWETIAWAFAGSSRPSVDIGGTTFPLGDEANASAARASQHLKDLTLREREHLVATIVEQLEPAGPDPADHLWLDWDGARSLARRGFTIGSHSLAHPILGREDARAQHDDLSEASRLLREATGQEVDTVAYPNGRAIDVDEHTARAALAAGHRYGFLLEAGRNHAHTEAYALRRAFVLPQRGPRGLYVQLGLRAIEVTREVVRR